ncbi:MAG: hypothetical protein K8S55_05150 [Phycisphaerae bacterium]|nr:hypothetical protein [Phycisphaerae bacterium]
MPVQLRENIYRTRHIPRTDAVLMGRAELLAPVDRDLIETILIRGQSAASVGRLMKISPRNVRQRVHRLGRRMTSRKFLDAARALPYLAVEDAEIARLYYCQCIPQRELGQRVGLTNHAIRRRLDFITAEIATIRRIRKGGILSGEGAMATQGSFS